MDKIIKIMGLPRSGTNALTVLMNLNFNNYVCDMQYHYVDYLGWKHAYPIDIRALNLIEKRINNEVVIIFLYREFNQWQESIYNRYSGQSSGEFTTYSFDFNENDGFIFNTPIGAELYKDLFEFYQNKVNSYKKFCDENPTKGILISYDELKNQKNLLEKLRIKFNLIKSEDTYIELKKMITFNNKITSKKI